MYGCATNRRQAIEWISDLDSPQLVCEIVRRVESGVDLRQLDLRIFKESLQERDFFVLTDNLRTLKEFNVAGCVTFSRTALLKVGQRCMFLETVVLDDVVEVDDGVLRVRHNMYQLEKRG